jgi:RNA recognition motif-containing protein
LRTRRPLNDEKLRAQVAPTIVNLKETNLNIYVGNLAFSVTEEDLKKAFEAFGQVASSNVIKDQYSNQSKGFGFVEMPESSEAKAAIAALNGKELNGRAINVNEARPKTDKGRSGFGGGGGRGGGFGGGRGRY